MLSSYRASCLDSCAHAKEFCRVLPPSHARRLTLTHTHLLWKRPSTCLSSLKCNVEQLTLIQPLGIIKSSSNIKPNPATCHCPSCLPSHVGACETVERGFPLLSKHQNIHSLPLSFFISPSLVFPAHLLARFYASFHTFDPRAHRFSQYALLLPAAWAAASGPP